MTKESPKKVFIYGWDWGRCQTPWNEQLYRYPEWKKAVWIAGSALGAATTRLIGEPKNPKHRHP